MGALQYLMIKRLDLAHLVNSISQFLHAPTEVHFRQSSESFAMFKEHFILVSSLLHPLQWA